ncbi:MAG: DUF721 domain-containing protein [Muribaculaceae bacterium]|nr:DUF721 domain-containing protein [Muribaculaceae bacterium]
MKRSDPESIGALWQRYVDGCGLRDNYEQQRVCYLWPEVVGPAVNRRTARRWVDGGVMHVVITSAPLKSELGMMRRDIVAHLNKAAGREVLTDIVFH